jgi:hypothetical protein
MSWLRNRAILMPRRTSHDGLQRGIVTRLSLRSLLALRRRRWRTGLLRLLLLLLLLLWITHTICGALMRRLIGSWNRALDTDNCTPNRRPYLIEEPERNPDRDNWLSRRRKEPKEQAGTEKNKEERDEDCAEIDLRDVDPDMLAGGKSLVELW